MRVSKWRSRNGSVRGRNLGYLQSETSRMTLPAFEGLQNCHFSGSDCQLTRNWRSETRNWPFFKFWLPIDPKLIKLTQNWPFFDGSTAKLTQIDPKLTQNWPFFWVLATYLLNNILIGRQWKCRKLSPSRGGYQAWKEGLGPATSERRPGLSSRKMDLSTTLKSRNLTPFFDLISLGMTNGRSCVDHQKPCRTALGMRQS
jgi:hypothetical protein